MSPPASIVIVDDDVDFQMCLSQLLRARGYAVDALSSGDQLLVQLNSGRIPSLILLDVMFPDADGIEVLKKIKATGMSVPVVMISGSRLVRNVVEAMKLGALDFLTKPVSDTEVEAVLANVFEKNSSEHVVPEPEIYTGFVTLNAEVRRIAEIAKRVALTNVPILLLGESGVGKEVLARYAHFHSGRGDKPFVKVNCAALPDELIESELFGYERGAFTGAVTDKSGKFEQAHTGTILLDEIGEMSPHMQAKLLHVIQDGVFTRLGGRKPIRVDVRIMASTNIKIEEAIAAGKFREDLYFRLNVISLSLPPLRERREDIPALCNYFFSKYRERYKAKAKELPAELLNSFLRYDWPGNIRQLENCVKQFLVLPNHHTLFADLNPVEEAEQRGNQDTNSVSLLAVGAAAAERAERFLVGRVLQETHGNRRLAALRLNICYKALLNKLKRWQKTTGVPPTTSKVIDNHDKAA